MRPQLPIGLSPNAVDLQDFLGALEWVAVTVRNDGPGPRGPDAREPNQLGFRGLIEINRDYRPFPRFLRGGRVVLCCMGLACP